MNSFNYNLDFFEKRTTLVAPDGGSSQTHLSVRLDLKYERNLFVSLSTITMYSVQVSPSAGAVALFFTLLLFFGVNDFVF